MRILFWIALYFLIFGSFVVSRNVKNLLDDLSEEFIFFSDPDIQDDNSDQKKDMSSSMHVTDKSSLIAPATLATSTFRDLYVHTLKPHLKEIPLREMTRTALINSFFGWPLWTKQTPMFYNRQLLKTIRAKRGRFYKKKLHLRRNGSSKAKPFNDKYLFFVPYQGLSNQFLQLAKAAVLAKELQRTLIVPPMILSQHQVGEDGSFQKLFLEMFGITPMLPWSFFYSLSQWESEVDMIPLTDSLLRSLLYTSSKNFKNFVIYNENSFNGIHSRLVYGPDGNILPDFKKYEWQRKKVVELYPDYKIPIELQCFGKWNSKERLGEASQYFFESFSLDPTFAKIPETKEGHNPIQFQVLFDHLQTLQDRQFIAVANLQHVNFKSSVNEFLRRAEYSDWIISLAMKINSSKSGASRPYLAMHWRAGDWEAACKKGKYKKNEQCFPTLSEVDLKIASLRESFLGGDTAALNLNSTQLHSSSHLSATNLLNSEQLSLADNMLVKLATNEENQDVLNHFASRGYLIGAIEKLLPFLKNEYEALLQEFLSYESLSDLLKADGRLFSLLVDGIIAKSILYYPVAYEKEPALYENIYQLMRSTFITNRERSLKIGWQKTFKSMHPFANWSILCADDNSPFDRQFSRYFPRYFKRELDFDEDPLTNSIEGDNRHSACDSFNGPPPIQFDPFLITISPFLQPMLDSVTLGLSDVFLGNIYSTFSKSVVFQRHQILSKIESQNVTYRVPITHYF